jgi:hypothetical protein
MAIGRNLPDLFPSELSEVVVDKKSLSALIKLTGLILLDSQSNWK